MKQNVIVGGYYRHWFTGRMFLVLNLCRVKNSKEKFVCGQWYGSFETFLIPVKDFEKRVSDAVVNVNQEYEYQYVPDLGKMLNTYTTEALVAELLTRKDNPYAGVVTEGIKDNIISDAFLVGDIVHGFDDDGNSYVEDFDWYESFSSSEGAVSFLNDRCTRKMSVARKVVYITDLTK